MGIKIPAHELAFSTAWLGDQAGQARVVVEAALQLDLHWVKIGPLHGEASWDVYSQYLKSKKLKVIAAQDALRLGSGLDHRESEPGLGDPQPGDQHEAMAQIVQTAQAARALGTDKVIVRLGSMKNDKLLELGKTCRSLFEKEGRSGALQEILEQGKKIFSDNLEAYLDRILRALFSLLKADRDIKFCIETGCDFPDLPDLQAMRYILEDLKSPRIGYWHNTFHGHYQESLGLAEKGTWLGEFGAHTRGVHLHDALGLEGYLPPGVGEVDFRGLKESLPSDALAVLDLPPTCSLEACRMGLSELARMGF